MSPARYIQLRKTTFKNSLITLSQAISIVEGKGFSFLAEKKENGNYRVIHFKHGEFFKYTELEYTDPEEAEFTAYMSFAMKIK